MIFQNVGFKDQTIYHRMEPGNYTLQFKSSASGLKMFEDLPIKLAPGALYTVYTIGYNTDDSKRKAILVQDGV